MRRLHANLAKLRRGLGVMSVGAICFGLSGLEVQGQERSQLPRTAVLVIDFDELFATSRIGQDIQKKQERQLQALSNESARIDADMAAEEQALTEQRDSLSAEEFRALADAFDEKVQRLRRTQDQKAQDLARIQQEERLRFRQLSLPILGKLMLDSGASVVMETRNVLIFNDAVNVTDITAAALDERGAADDTTQETPQDPEPESP